MRATRLIAVLVAIAAIAIAAADAKAVYHPTMGRFLQRDPGAGGGSPARTGTAGPAVGGGFIPRDPTGSDQYADGMNLYQYVLGNPTVHVDLMGLSSRKTKFWHFRGYGKKKIYAFLIEQKHSVISLDQSMDNGVDYGPRDKKEGKKDKTKIDGLAWAFWGTQGYTTPWKIQLPLDDSREMQEKWQLCITTTGTMKNADGDKDIYCCDATEDEIRSCITRVARVWNDTTWRNGHDCRDFVAAAESECCLENCNP